jgi:mono/diheme cytochrome c family protein
MLETVKNPAKISKAFVWFMLVAFFATISINSSAQTGEELFKANCSACHKAD